MEYSKRKKKAFDNKQNLKIPFFPYKILFVGAHKNTAIIKSFFFKRSLKLLQL